MKTALAREHKGWELIATFYNVLHELPTARATSTRPPSFWWRLPRSSVGRFRSGTADRHASSRLWRTPAEGFRRRPYLLETAEGIRHREQLYQRCVAPHRPAYARRALASGKHGCQSQPVALLGRHLVLATIFGRRLPWMQRSATSARNDRARPTIKAMRELRRAEGVFRTVARSSALRPRSARF